MATDEDKARGAVTVADLVADDRDDPDTPDDFAVPLGEVDP